MGELPMWYRLIRAARAMHVAPWELAKQPAVWMHWALAAENAETKAREQLEKHR